MKKSKTSISIPLDPKRQQLAEAIGYLLALQWYKETHARTSPESVESPRPPPADSGRQSKARGIQ